MHVRSNTICRVRSQLFFIVCVTIFMYAYWNIFLRNYTTKSFSLHHHKYLDQEGDETGVQGTQNNVSISLFLRLAGKRKDHQGRFYCNILKTVALFWPPSLGKMVIVLDDEVKEDHAFGRKLLNQTTEHFPFISFDVKHEPLPKDEAVLHFPHQLKTDGYNRQLWSSFFLDLYTNDDIVAWLESDSPFLFPVTLPTIISDGKVLISGSECSMGIGWVKSWARTTERAIGFPQVADFMTYFPVYIYRDTFTRCREHILKRYNTHNFEEAFKKFYHTGKGFISPVAVIISYAWYFEKARYSWSIEICGNLSVYNDRFPEGHKIHPEHVRNGLTLTQPQTAYHGPFNKDDFYAKVVPISYCLVQAAAGQKPEMCKKHHAEEINILLSLFKADMHSARINRPHPCTGNYTKKCLNILHHHIERVGEEIKSRSRIMDWENLDKINAFVRSSGVTCPPHPV